MRIAVLQMTAGIDPERPHLGSHCGAHRPAGRAGRRMRRAFWTAFALSAYVYFGYPGLLALVRRRWRVR